MVRQIDQAATEALTCDIDMFIHGENPEPYIYRRLLFEVTMGKAMIPKLYSVLIENSAIQ